MKSVLFSYLYLGSLAFSLALDPLLVCCNLTMQFISGATYAVVKVTRSENADDTNDNLQYKDGYSKPCQYWQSIVANT